MAATDARPVPQYGAAFRVYFALRYLDGRLDTGWVNPSGFISKDGGAFANVTSNPVEFGSRGCGYCDLTSAEMTADGVTLILQDTKAILSALPNSGIPLVLTFYPEQIGDYRIAVPSGAIAEAVWNETVAGNIFAGTFGDALNQASGTILRQGATGAGLTAIPTITNVSNLINFPSGAIADAVWDEQVATHQVFGTAGRALMAASGNVFAGVLATPTNIAGGTITTVVNTTNLTNMPSGAIAQTVWDRQVSTSRAAGTFGDALNQASGISLRQGATGTGLTAIPTIANVSNLINFPSGAVADAVWDEVLSGHQVIGTTGYALNVASGNLIGGAGGASAADVWAYASRTLTSFPSGAFADAVWDEYLPSHLSADSAGDWLYISATRNVDPWDEDLTTYGTGTAAYQIYTALNATSGTVLNGTIDANIVTVNGVPVDTDATIDANVVQVSGVYVTLSDFNTGGTGGDSAATIWAYANRTLTSFPSGAFAEAVWNETVAGNIAAGTFGDALNQASGVSLRQGATGTGLSAIPTIANVSNLINFPSGAVADAVWDEQINTHQVFGTAGRALMAASGDGKLAAGSITSTTFATDAISAAAFSQAAADEVWNTTSRTITGGTVANLTNFPSGAIAEAVWNETIVGNIAAGTFGDALNQASGISLRQGATGTGLSAIPWNTAWAAPVNAEVDSALNTAIPGSPVADSINERLVAIDTKLPSASYLTGTSNSDGSISTITNVTNLTNFPSGAIADAVWDEAIAQHQVIGTTGYALNAASGNLIGAAGTAPTAADNANAVWAKAVNTSIGAGTFGDALNQASGLLLNATFGLSAIKTQVAAIEVDTQDLQTQVGVDGAGLTAIPTIANVSNLINFPSGAIADAVWDEVITTHNVNATAGHAMMIASGILNNIIRADVVKFSGEWVAPVNAVPANLTQVSGQLIHIADFNRPLSGTITTTTNLTNLPTMPTDWITAVGLSAGAVDEIVDQVWNEALSTHLTAGTTGDALNQASGTVLRQGATGAGLSAIPTITNVTNVANLTNFPSGAIADAVWDEQLSTHVVSGTTGKALSEASGNTTPTVIGTSVWTTPGTRTITGGTVTTLTNLPAITSNWLTAAGLDATAVDEIVDQVWNEVLSGHQTVGSTGYALNAASGNLIGAAGTAPSTADIWSYGSRTLTGIPEVNVIQVSGEYVSAQDSVVDVNIVQVSGQLIHINDFNKPTSGTITTATNLTNLPTMPTDWITAIGLSTGAVDEIVDQVWNEVLSTHVTAGTTGDALNQASGTVLRQGPTGAGLTAIPTIANVSNLINLPSGAIADAVWGEQINTHQVFGSAGRALMAASGDAKLAVGAITTTTFAAGAIDANAIATDAIGANEFSQAAADKVWNTTVRTVHNLINFPSGAIVDLVWDELIGQHQVVGSTGYALNAASGNFIGSVGAAPTVTQIRQEIDANSIQLSSLSGLLGAVKVKTDYLPSVAPGSTGGLFRVGQNSPIAIVGTGDALAIISTGSNGHGISTFGNGTGHGFYTYGNNGNGIYAYSNFDAAVEFQSANGYGMHVIGGGFYDIFTISNAGSWDGNSTHTADDVWTSATRTLTSIPSGAIADAVWDEQISTHSVFGTAGRALTAASGNVFAGVLATPTNITAGTISNLINFPSGAVADAVWDEQINTHQAFGTAGRALMAASGDAKLAIGAITTTTFATGAIDSNAIGLSAVQEIADEVWASTTKTITGGTVTNLMNFPSGAIADAIWDEILGQHQTIGTTGYALNKASGIAGGDTAATIWGYGSRTLTGIVDANTVQISGQWVSWEAGPVDANVVQVSGQYVSIEDFATPVSMSGGATAAEVWAYGSRTLTSIPSGAIAEAVWNEQVTGNIYAGTFGDALNQASGLLMNASYGLSAIKTQVAAIEVDTQDLQTQIGVDGAGLTNIPTIANVSNLINFPSGAIADAVWDEQVATHSVFGTAGRALTAASGNVFAGVLATPTNITAGTITNLINFPSGAVADAVWDEVLGQHQVIGTTGYALNTASGNLIGGTTLTAAQVWTYSDRQLTAFPSGAFADAIWDEVLGQHQVFGTTGYALNTASGNLIGGTGGSISGVVSANIVSISGIPVNIDSSSVADSQELSTLGDLLLRRARIIRLVP